MDLFDTDNQSQAQPLAARMRPRTLEEYIGQEHIIGPGRLLRRAIQADQLGSLIFYGPPGTGKTTLAQVIANTTKSHFSTLNAVLSGVKELRETIAEAKERRDLYDRRTILFIDEVHRWNKSQQDALLPWVENGTVILIGATTENPFFEVNKALVSRSRVFQLKPLQEAELHKVAKQAIADPVRGYGKLSITWEQGALEHLIDVANGDARSLLNALELALATTPARPADSERAVRAADTNQSAEPEAAAQAPPAKSGSMREVRNITLEIAEQSIQEKAVLYDKEGDYHFDVISAFIKSIRGSDPDAVLYWLARMLQAGESPRFIFRRMLISACEDIGLANPNAIVVVEANAAAFDRIGLPEGRFHLTHAALYLATSPKSNSCMAIFDAAKAVGQEKSGEVPNHLKDDNRDGAAFGHGEGYLYPHAYRDHWVAQQYLPGALQGRTFYQPADTGYEAGIKQEVERRREIQLATIHPEESAEVLTFSPPSKETEHWLQRISAQQNHLLQTIRTTLFELLEIKRHHRLLDLNAASGLLLWEAVRRTPEGVVWGLLGPSAPRDMLEHYAAGLPELSRPHLVTGELATLLDEETSPLEEGLRFDVVIGQNVFLRGDRQAAESRRVFELLAPGGQLALSVVIPRRSTRLSHLLEARSLEPEALAQLQQAEDMLYGENAHPLVSWDADHLLAALEHTGFCKTHHEIRQFTEKRQLRKEDIQRWLVHTPGMPTYGSLLAELLPTAGLQSLQERILRLLERQHVQWQRSLLFIRAARL